MSEPKVHDLKILPEFFEAVLSGAKTAELRVDDRGFAVGDTLRLREWESRRGRTNRPEVMDYTGREVSVIVTHILRPDTFPSLSALNEGYAMLSFARLEAADTRLLAAAEVEPDLGYNCPSCDSWNYLHPQELSDADSVVECGNEDCAAQVRIVVNLRAAIEQRKEGRS